MKNTRLIAILAVIAGVTLLVGFLGWGPVTSVFLFPEEWLSPEVRDNQSEFFKPMDEYPIEGALLVCLMLLVPAFTLVTCYYLLVRRQRSIE